MALLAPVGKMPRRASLHDGLAERLVTSRDGDTSQKARQET
jgi:hypothetical protein